MLNPEGYTKRQLVLKGLFCLVLAIFIMDRLAHHLFWPAPEATEIVLLSSAKCPYSRAAKAHLEANGVPFREVDSRRDPFSAAFASWAFQSVRVPIVVVGPEIIHGYRAEQIDAALAELGYPVARKSTASFDEGAPASAPN